MECICLKYLLYNEDDSFVQTYILWDPAKYFSWVLNEIWIIIQWNKSDGERYFAVVDFDEWPGIVIYSLKDHAASSYWSKNE